MTKKNENFQFGSFYQDFINQNPEMFFVDPSLPNVQDNNQSYWELANEIAKQVSIMGNVALFPVRATNAFLGIVSASLSSQFKKLSTELRGKNANFSAKAALKAGSFLAATAGAAGCDVDLRENPPEDIPSYASFSVSENGNYNLNLGQGGSYDIFDILQKNGVNRLDENSVVNIYVDTAGPDGTDYKFGLNTQLIGLGELIGIGLAPPFRGSVRTNSLNIYAGGKNVIGSASLHGSSYPNNAYEYLNADGYVFGDFDLLDSGQDVIIKNDFGGQLSFINDASFILQQLGIGLINKDNSANYFPNFKTRSGPVYFSYDAETQFVVPSDTSAKIAFKGETVLINCRPNSVFEFKNLISRDPNYAINYQPEEGEYIIFNRKDLSKAAVYLKGVSGFVANEIADMLSGKNKRTSVFSNEIEPTTVTTTTTLAPTFEPTTVATTTTATVAPTTTTNNNHQIAIGGNNSHGLNNSEKAGFVVGGVILATFILAACFKLRRRDNRVSFVEDSIRENGFANNEDDLETGGNDFETGGNDHPSSEKHYVSNDSTVNSCIREVDEDRELSNNYDENRIEDSFLNSAVANNSSQNNAGVKDEIELGEMNNQPSSSLNSVTSGKLNPKNNETTV
jgi:hypothetical protein